MNVSIQRSAGDISVAPGALRTEAPLSPPLRAVKVAHLTSVHSPFDVRIFHKECRSLARAGLCVTLVVPHSRDEFVDGVRIKALPKGAGRLARMTWTVWKVFREALRQRADVYQFHDPELIPACILLQLCGKRVIYDIHEDVPKDILSKDYLPSWSRQPLSRLMEQLEGVAGRQFSALVTVTPSIAVRFLSRNSRTVLVHNFPDLSEAGEGLKRPWDQRAESIAYVGGILPERGVREMIQAMALLPETLACRLQIATDDFPNGLLRQVSSAPGWARVDHVGYLSRGQVADLLGRVRAGIVIFHPEPNNVTAMPNKLFEYMAAGIPVIASDFPLWREIVEGANCGILVDPLCPRSIAQAIEYLLTHPVEAEAMGGRGRMAVENSYNWNTEARKLLDLYSCLMDPACAG